MGIISLCITIFFITVIVTLFLDACFIPYRRKYGNDRWCFWMYQILRMDAYLIIIKYFDLVNRLNSL